MRYKRYIGNTALAAAGLAAAYLLIEFFLFPTFLPLAPLKFQSSLGNLRLLSQSSKNGHTPRDYIGLVGDSYAQGAGDWLLATDPDTNGAFHSAHVIHNQTRRDVASFGHGGAGSIDGIMLGPIQKFNRINSSWRYYLEKPRVLIVYFYEGNDLYDNLKTIKKYLGSDLANVGDQLEHFVQKKYNEAASTTLPPYENAYAAKFFWGVINYNFGGDQKRRKRAYNRKSETATETINKARVGGATVVLPDELQSPALQLSEVELYVALKAFEEALAGLRRFFPEARLIVTIIPAPLTSYHLVSRAVRIQKYDESRASVYPAAQVPLKSNWICELVAAASRRVGAEFFDVRAPIRALAETQLLHGPIDWRHFNRQGYTELGKRLSAYLEEPNKDGGDCVSLN